VKQAALQFFFGVYFTDVNTGWVVVAALSAKLKCRNKSGLHKQAAQQTVSEM
jgi:hypothetical protein